MDYDYRNYMSDCIHLKACRRIQKIGRSKWLNVLRYCTEECSAYETVKEFKHENGLDEPLNKPLTKEELMHMKGQPVWTIGVSFDEDCWDIIESVDESGISFGYSTEGREWWSYNLRDPRGELLIDGWLCYRKPPVKED